MSLFGAQARSGRGRGGSLIPDAAKIITPRCCSILQASLHGGTRTFTLRMPEIDAEGRLVSKERTLNVQVPKGILAGQQIRLAGQGARARGDRNARAIFTSKSNFSRILCTASMAAICILELPVAPWEAALGATRENAHAHRQRWT